MRLGIRSKLFLVSLFLIVLVGGASGGYLEGELRTLLETKVKVDLARLAALCAEAVSESKPVPEVDVVDRVADRLGKAIGVRVVIMNAARQVLGDSGLEPDEIRDHAAPVAFNDETPFDGVHSGLMYAAAQSTGPNPLLVRVAMPLREVDEVIRHLRVMILGAGLVGLAIAVLMSGLASHLVSTTFRRLVDNTRALAQGTSRRVDIASRDEIGHLAGSINRMAEELEKTVSALAQERDRFETAIEAMSEALLVIDSEQVVTMVNPAMKQLLGVKRSFEGHRLAEIVRVPALAELVASAKREPASAEFSLPGTVERQLLARATPIRSSGGQVVVMLDVTEMRRLERVRKDFVANVSHELRTPVSIIRANAETLLSGALEDPKRARGFVEAQLRSAERLSGLVADLLDLARLEAGKFRLEMISVSLEPALRRSADAVAAQVEKKELHVEISADDSLRVEADPKALDQVLLNLLDNAAKYSPRGGRIVLRGKSFGGLIRIEVEDQGPGIEPKHRARIFERFYRIDPGRSRDFGGTGLGLAIVKHLVESMNGQVGVDAASPTGSVFWLTLPVAEQVAA